MAARPGRRGSQRRNRPKCAACRRSRHRRGAALIRMPRRWTFAEGISAVMQAGFSKISATLEALIKKGLLDRLPVTFAAYWFEQFREWNLLFPAEKDYYERLFSLLDRSGRDVVDRWFARMRQIEIL